jgi:hypothetical protein
MAVPDIDDAIPKSYSTLKLQLGFGSSRYIGKDL